MLRRRSAKLLYWLAGRLPTGSWIQSELLMHSQQLDWDHWEHWACEPMAEMETVTCLTCGGQREVLPAGAMRWTSE